ncbi:hypothetical protein B0H19DRAFT_1185198 [Mycena capillaripes]|nr:hypothetical protein B0H19DRAFT_1185198 [Mycena capillaripes]
MHEFGSMFGLRGGLSVGSEAQELAIRWKVIRSGARLRVSVLCVCCFISYFVYR